MGDWPVTEGVLELGDLEVVRGGTIRGARLAWQASVLKAVEEVENALAGYNRDARAVDAQSRLVSNASESVSLTQTSYELGEAGFFPVLDAERTLLSARQELAGAVRQQALNFIALSAASAGGVGLN